MKRQNVTDELLTLDSILWCGWIARDVSFYKKILKIAFEYDEFPFNCISFYQAVCLWGFEVLYE